MAKCAHCGSLKVTERPCPKCGSWDNAKAADTEGGAA